MIEHDALLRAIQNRDVNKARTILDRAFWRKENTTPSWEHLKQSLTECHQPMINLLVTWGATPTQAEWKKYQDEYDTKPPSDTSAFSDSAKKLKRAGLNLNTLPETTANDNKGLITPHVDYIPEEWKNVLSAIQQAGGKDACIAGGALRDLFNQKSINDVDIFLYTQGSTEKNKRLILNAFKKANLFCALDQNKMRKGKLTHTVPVHSLSIPLDLYTQSWDIIGGTDNTKYNIVFMNKNSSGALGQTEFYKKYSPSDVCQIFFDYNICKIIFDGTDIKYKDQFIRDSKQKTITWDTRNKTSLEHLYKITKKYSDFSIDPKLEAFIKTEKEPPKKNTSSTYRTIRSSYRRGY